MLLLGLCLSAGCAEGEPPDEPAGAAEEAPEAAPMPGPGQRADLAARHLPPERAALPAQAPPTPILSPEQTGRYDEVQSEAGGAARWTPPPPVGTAELARRQREYLEASRALDDDHAALGADERDRRRAELKRHVLGE